MHKARIKRNINRPDSGLIKELGQYPTSIISDSINRLGVMSSQIGPIVRGRPFCGPAVTVEETEGGNLMSHAALELLQPGDVMVIDAKAAKTRSCWGGLQTYMAQKKGAKAVVVNGLVRDYEDIKNYKISVYACGISPAGPLKRWGGHINYPVSCAGVVVSAGDVVAGDDDGVVVVPAAYLNETIAVCKQRKAKEKEWFKKVGEGQPTLDVVGLRSMLEELGIEYL